MKAVTVPENISINKDGKDAEFGEFIMLAVDLNSKVFGTDMKNIKIGLKISDIAENCKPGDDLEFEDEHFDLLYNSLSNLEVKPNYARQVLPFYEAMETAKIEEVKLEKNKNANSN